MMKKAIASLVAVSLMLGTAAAPMAAESADNGTESAVSSEAAVSEAAVSEAAEPEKPETGKTENKEEKADLGSLIDSLIEQGKETYTELAGQANEILGNNGVLEELLGPESDVVTTLSSLTASINEARDKISISFNEVMGTLSEDGGELGGLVSKIKVTVSTTGGELISSAKEVAESFKKDKKSTASKLLGLASTYLGIELPEGEESKDAAKEAESAPEQAAESSESETVSLAVPADTAAAEKA